LGQRDAIAVALGDAREVVNRRLAGAYAVADREVEGVEVRVSAHAFPAFLRCERGHEERQGLAVLLGHDGGLGARAVDVPVLLAEFPAAAVARVEGLDPGLEEGALVRRPQALGGQDRELVAAVRLAQAPDDVLAVVVLRGGRGGEQGEG
jgi:hypothetical protein